MDFSGKTVLITGASGIGIGNRIARDFYSKGANIVICSLNLEDILATKSEIAGNDDDRILAIKADMRNVEDITNLVDLSRERFGGVNILVNNAGVVVHGPSIDVSEMDWSYVIDTKLRGYFFMAQQVAKCMVANSKPGSIINIGSVNGIVCTIGSCVYAIANAGVSQMTRSLAREWGPYGIRVNCIGPGSIPTLMNKEKYSDPMIEKKFCSNLPLGRRGKTEEISDAVQFLASDEAAYITGQTVYVDGGLTVNYG